MLDPLLVQLNQNFFVLRSRRKEKVYPRTVRSRPRRGINGFQSKFFSQDLRRSVHIRAKKLYLLNSAAKLGEISCDCAVAFWSFGRQYIQMQSRKMQLEFHRILVRRHVRQPRISARAANLLKELWHHRDPNRNLRLCARSQNERRVRKPRLGRSPRQDTACNVNLLRRRIPQFLVGRSQLFDLFFQFHGFRDLSLAERRFTQSVLASPAVTRSSRSQESRLRFPASRLRKCAATNRPASSLQQMPARPTAHT